MNADKLRLKIKRILGFQVVFNKDFEKHADKLQGQEQNLLLWCKALKNGEIRHIPSPRFRDNAIFIRKIGSSTRCIVINVVNGRVSEVHLGDHAYYDKLRVKLGLKKDSR